MPLNDGLQRQVREENTSVIAYESGDLFLLILPLGVCLFACLGVRLSGSIRKPEA